MLGEIGRPHGVRGLVRVRSFTAEPEALGAYGPLTDEAGAREFRLTMLAPDLARIEGVADREAAAKLTGTKLYVAREALPPPEEEDEFYLADLEGLRADLADGTPFGTVAAVEDHGAGAFLTVRLPDGRERLIPFTRACVPVVAVAEGRLVVEPPSEVAGEERAA
ncbi:MAG: ribosome maturation factor RimM [Acetobacteraceae bacterium]|nr:ribosome maturation factor RimM [Acetobacteraceae bacterium]